MFVAYGIWCFADVLSVSPSSLKTLTDTTYIFSASSRSASSFHNASAILVIKQLQKLDQEDKCER